MAHPEPRRRSRRFGWLLLIPLVATLIPEIYDRVSPSIGGMPFFYWYQLAWVLGGVICTYAVYRATRGR